MDRAHSPLEPLQMGCSGSHFTKRCQQKALKVKKAMQDPMRSQGERKGGNILDRRKIGEETGTLRRDSHQDKTYPYVLPAV